ncbi:glucosaminidase domain-containing protein [Vibrio sonorensis]|uniref:glucosaminidase domain-containing protein n=1 Tax=Vibrio sonorensis TaxID=1004316 RepID=UPI0008DA5B19|nr:glucosaminidase domain-containing protein [Vibrio sonorensis]
MRKFEVVTLGLAVAVAIYGFTTYQHPAPKTESDKSELVILPVGNAPDFAAIDNTKEKKQAFFDFLRPGIAIENSRINKERKRLLAIQQHFEANYVSSEDMAYAQRLGKLYSNPIPATGIDERWLTSMLKSVNVLPESLVLTQAANESAWGTSRFAREANNYFGQWCYTKGCGLVPLKRSEGMTHEVAKFSSVQESIHRYFMNVNRNRAYRELRDIRSIRDMEQLAMTSPEAAVALSEGLLRYSERGEAYVKDLQTMIRHNQTYWQ